MWLYRRGGQKEAYADYMGSWYGEKGSVSVELKIEQVKNLTLNAYVILSEEEYELLRTDFSGEIREDGSVLTNYDTGQEKGRIRLDLKNDIVEISAYQTEAEEMNLWGFGSLPTVYLKKTETGSR